MDTATFNDDENLKRMDVPAVNAIDKASKNHVNKLFTENEPQMNVPQNDTNVETSHDHVLQSLNGSKVDTNSTQNGTHEKVSQDLIPESFDGKESEMDMDVSNIAVLTVESLRSDYVPELLNENGSELSMNLPQIDIIREASDPVPELSNETELNMNLPCNSTIAEASDMQEGPKENEKKLDANKLQDGPNEKEEASGDQIPEFFNEKENDVSTDGPNIAVVMVQSLRDDCQDSVPSKGIELEKNTKEKVREDFEGIDSESSADEFSKTIGDVAEQALLDDEEEIKILDVPKKDTPKACVSLSSDDDDDLEFDKTIEDAVSEAFEQETPEPIPIEFEMSIQVENQKIKVECSSPEPNEAEVGLKKITAKQLSKESNKYFANWQGPHAFTISISYLDSQDADNCAFYSEQKNKLYITKDYEFQVLCSAKDVPESSILRACPFFTSPGKAGEVVTRCPSHMRDDLINGKPAVEHVVQSLNEGAVYDRFKDSGRLNVIIPFRSPKGTNQQPSDRSTYFKLKLSCSSFCEGIKNRPFAIHFTLEYNGVVWGRQCLNVEVIQCPEDEGDTGDEASTHTEESGKNCRIIHDFILPALDAKTFGDHLYWDTEVNGAFFIKWTHKAAACWSEDQSKVFREWDILKGRPPPVEVLDFVFSKQRFRAALRNSKIINEIICDLPGFKRYAITNIKQLRNAKLRKEAAIARNSSSPGVDNSRLPRQVKLETHTYEEMMSEGEDSDYKSDSSKKRRPPSKSAKSKKSPTSETRIQPESIRPKIRKKPGPKPKALPLAMAKKSGSKSKVSVPPMRNKPGPKSKSAGLLSSSQIKRETEKVELSPRVNLMKLTLNDVLQAGVKIGKEETDSLKKMEACIEKFSSKPTSKSKSSKSKPMPKSQKVVKNSGKCGPPLKTSPKKKPSSIPSTKTTNKSHQAPGPKASQFTMRDNFATNRINFPATLHQTSPILSSVLSCSSKEKPEEEPKTFENIKTQSDMIDVLIKTSLPNLPHEKRNEVFDLLVELGVENVDDLAYIEEDDLNKVLKPIQSRKLMATWKSKGGVSATGMVLPKRNLAADNVTYVPAAYQMSGMPSDHQSSLKHQIFSPSEHQSGPKHQIFSAIPDAAHQSQQATIIPSWRQGTLQAMQQKRYSESGYATPYTADMNSSNAWRQSTATSIPPKLYTESSCALPVMNQNSWGQKIVEFIAHTRSPQSSSSYSSSKDVNSYKDQSFLSAPQNIYPESNYSVPSKKNIVSNSSETWADRFVIPWDKMPTKIIKSLSMKKRLSSGYRSIMFQLVCDVIFAITSDPSPRDVEIIAKKLCEEYPESLCDEHFGQLHKTECTTLTQQLMFKINKVKAQYVKNPTPSEDKSQKQLSTHSNKNQRKTNVATPKTNASSTETSNVSSSKHQFEDFSFMWHKMPRELLNCVHRKQMLNTDQRIKFIRFLTDQIDHLKPDPNDMDIFSRKVFESFPSLRCHHMDGQKGLAKLMKTRLKNLLRTSRNVSVHQASEVSSSQTSVDACRSSVSPQLAESDSSAEVSSPQSVDVNSIPTGPSNWALAFAIPWEKMSSKLMDCLQNQERPSPALMQDMVSVICKDIRKVQPNPDSNSMCFIAKKACEEYPESFFDYDSSEGIGYESLARQLLLRINHVNRKCGYLMGNSKRKQVASDSAECPVKKFKVEHESEKDYFLNMMHM